MAELRSTEETEKKFDNLLDFIDEEDSEELELDEGNEISTPDEAEYYIRKYKETEQEIENINTRAENYLNKKKEQIENWKENQLADHKRSIEYYSSLLEGYTRKQLEGTKKKSLKLIEGTLQVRTSPQKYDYDVPTIQEYIKEKIAETVIPTEELDFLIIEDEDGDKSIDLEELNKLVAKIYSKHYIRLKEELDKSTLKKELDVKDGQLIWEGEPVPGVTVTDGETKFSVK